MKTNYFSHIEIMRAENGVIVKQRDQALGAQASGAQAPWAQAPWAQSNGHVFTDIEELFEFLKKKIVMPDMPQPAPAVVPESYKYDD